MMKKIVPFFLLFTLFSCSNVDSSQNRDSEMTMTDSLKTDTPSSTEKELVKDEDGFYVLPDGYLEKGKKEEGKKRAVFPIRML